MKALRHERGLSQAMLAARCGIHGWDASENLVTKVETRVRCVTDFELVCLAKALGVTTEDLLPPGSEKAAKAILTSRHRQ